MSDLQSGCNVFICVHERVSSMLMRGYKALEKSQSRNTLIVFSLDREDLEFLKELYLHASAVT